MKKHVGKLVSLVLAIAMVLTMCIGIMPAMAADPTYSLTITGTTAGHSYSVYQIYTGKLSTDPTTNEKVLSDVKYGRNYGNEGTTVPETELTELKKKTGKEAAKSFTVSGEAFTTATSAATQTVISGLPAGYYLVKETGTTTPAGEGMTDLILQVVGDTSIAVKSGTTESSKKVKDINDSTEIAVGSLQDSADWDIGDDVPFQLKAKVASDYDNYGQTFTVDGQSVTAPYKLTFHDVESTGLTFNANSVVVRVDGTQIDRGYEVVTTGLTDGCTFEIKFANLKSIASVEAGSVITVDYTSRLNDKAVVGSKGNPNKSNITFTNSPSDSQGGENGKTPWDNVIVFTYDVEVNKVDQDKKPLTGAEFTIEKYNATTEKWEAKTVIKNDAGTTFTLHGIDDGKYRITETKTPDGYNSIDPIYFTVTAEHVIESDSPTLTNLTGTAYKADGTEFTDAEKTAGKVASFTATLKETAAKLSTDVVNKAGSTLPSTGGIGTTIFYVVGIVLVLGAAIVLVSRRKNNAQ